MRHILNYSYHEVQTPEGGFFGHWGQVSILFVLLLELTSCKMLYEVVMMSFEGVYSFRTL